MQGLILINVLCILKKKVFAQLLATLYYSHIFSLIMSVKRLEGKGSVYVLKQSNTYAGYRPVTLSHIYVFCPLFLSIYQLACLLTYFTYLPAYFTYLLILFTYLFYLLILLPC